MMRIFARSGIILCWAVLLCNHVMVGYAQETLEDLEAPELRSMLSASLEQNRKLAQQNQRLKLIWKGLQQMCSALQLNTCDGDTDISTQKPDDGSSHDKQMKHKIDTPGMGLYPLRIVSVSSGGIDEDGCVTASATYQAPRQHSTDWLQASEMGLALRSTGSITVIEPGREVGMYKTTASICYIPSDQFTTTMLRIYTANHSVSVMFNKGIFKNGTQDLPEPDTILLSWKPTYQAVVNQDLNVTLVVNGSLHDPGVDEALRAVEIFFQGVNASSNPPSLIELTSLRFETKMTQRNMSTSNLVITMNAAEVKNGGLLHVALPQSQEMGGVINSVYFGRLVHILSPTTRKVVPDNTFGLFELPTQTLLSKPSHSIICATMGWPVPEVNFYRRLKDGSEKKINTELVVRQEYIYIRSLVLPPNRKAAGRYICRATQGNTTRETSTQAIMHVPLKFDDRKTALLKNTTRKLVVSCKASGVPRPDLKLKSPNGDDFPESSQYKISRQFWRKNAARITLTVQPVDGTISHVTCVASQGESRHQRYYRSRDITVFPGSSAGMNYTISEDIMYA